MTHTRALGKVVDVGYNGKLIIKAYGEVDPKNTVMLVDSSGKRLGKVTDIIGPVSAPYIIATPDINIKNHLLTLMGQDVYMGEVVRKRSGRYGRRGKKG